MSKEKTKTNKDKSLLSYYGFTKAEQKEYPVITKILKQLTSKRIEREIKEVQEIELPPELQKWVEEYKKVGKRDDFIWKWAYKSIQLITLSDVVPKYYRSLLEVKFLMIMFITLLDDVADEFQDEKLLEEILKIPLEKESINFKQLSQKEKRYIELTRKIWCCIERVIKKYPRYKEFKIIFEFDIAQILNTMKYAFLVNKNPYLINKAEYWMYFPYNIQCILSCTIDLMCSLKFNIQEMGVIREIAWETQKMTQTVNWITTWEREIKENDFTSGVFAFAIDSGILKVNEIKKGNKLKIIKKIKKAKIEEKLLEKGFQCYDKINKLERKIKSINIKNTLSALKIFIILQLSSRGSY